MKSKDQLLQDLAFLTGTQATGRLSGSVGAYESAVYLSGQLKAAGLQPVEGDSYFQKVNVPAARLFGVPKLVVAKRAFTHRRDFSEIPTMAECGHYVGRLLVVREDEQLPQNDFAGRIILVPHRPNGFDLDATVDAAMKMAVIALLVEYGKPEWFYKTVWARKWRIPVFRLRRSLAQELAVMNGAEVEVELPLSNNILPCQNVLGLLHGTSSDFTLALMAHYDHIGDDPGGARFPGALDNASGVATILAVIRELASEPLPINILVAFLTGEESGLWGAKYLLARQPLPISAVINLDGIGSEPALSAMRLGHSRHNDWLAEMAAQVLEERGIAAHWIKGTDDSSVFISAGIPTVGLGQQPTRPGGSGMHIPWDTNDNLHIGTILDGTQVILDIVKTLAKNEIQIKEKSMSNENVFVKLIKKSVGLPTGEASCCASIPQATQETANQDCVDQSSDTSSCCGPQEVAASQESSNQCDEKQTADASSSFNSQDSISTLSAESDCCEDAASQESSDQCDEKQTAGPSSCCG